MFTGIVQAVGKVVSIEPTGIVVRPPSSFPESTLAVGESIAVNGCCLTALDDGEGLLRFDTSPETMVRTALSDLAPGDPVNLERAMRADALFGGHIVQGHVDCTGRIDSINASGNSAVFRIAVDPAFDRYLIQKGSVAVDGISLTVNEPQEGLFAAWIIPHTLEHTNLAFRRPGDRVNVEFDVLAKHVEKLMLAMLPKG